MYFEHLDHRVHNCTLIGKLLQRQGCINFNFYQLFLQKKMLLIYLTRLSISSCSTCTLSSCTWALTSKSCVSRVPRYLSFHSSCTGTVTTTRLALCSSCLSAQGLTVQRSILDWSCTNLIFLSVVDCRSLAARLNKTLISGLTN